MSVDPTGQQWLDFFAGGGRHDIAYNMRAVADVAHMDQVLLTGRVGLSASTILTGLSSIAPYWFYGGTTNPTFGFSQHGIHLPVVPLVKWDDIAAVIVKNLRGTLRRAQNGSMLADPGVGGERSESAELVFVVKNADLIASTITNPKCTYLVTHKDTASGQHWGTVPTRLEPDVGPEQAVQLVYLLQLMAEQRGIRIFHVGSKPGAIGSLVKQMYALN